MGKLYFTRHGQTVWNVENKICGGHGKVYFPGNGHSGKGGAAA